MQKRYDAFWQGEETDRAVLHLSIPDGVPCEEPADDRQRWADTAYAAMAAGHALAHTAYAAEGFPNRWINLGPGVLAAMIGGDCRFARDTVWFDQNPQLCDLCDIESYTLDPRHGINQLVLSMTRALSEHSRGRYTVGITDLGGTLDILASLRGTERLLMDLIDDPDGVLFAARHIDACWVQAFDESYAILKRNNPGGGLSCWIPIWCRDSWFPLQCDFSAMISPEAFDRFVMPSLRAQCAHLDHSIYHLDGPGELAHVDSLLSLDALDGIQWVPGAGNPSPAAECWFPLYEKIQRSGKRVVLTLGEEKVDAILNLLGTVSPRGLFVEASVATMEQAEEIIRKAHEYGRALR